LPWVVLVPLAELEAWSSSLLGVKSTRSKVEYYFTCGPVFLSYVFVHFSEVDLISYLDSDLFFFADPASLYDELGNASIGVIEHRFSAKLQHGLRFGIYNVGWLAFRRDPIGLECLRWWSDRCIEWCYNRVETNRFADQKYLDDWPTRFQSVHILKHKGANLAPWNLDNYRICERDGRVYVDDQPLIFFHFHGLKQLRTWLFDSNLALSGIRPNRTVRRKIFGVYIESLRRHARDEALTKSAKAPGHSAIRHLRSVVYAVIALARNSYLIVPRKRPVKSEGLR
jgi:hypothetical protein